VEVEEHDEVKVLIARAQHAGVLSHAEIQAAVSELDLDEEDLAELHALLERSGAELIDEVDPACMPATAMQPAPGVRPT